MRANAPTTIKLKESFIVIKIKSISNIVFAEKEITPTMDIAKLIVIVIFKFRLLYLLSRLFYQRTIILPRHFLHYRQR